jgi:hypothetical protein
MDWMWLKVLALSAGAGVLTLAGFFFYSRWFRKKWFGHGDMEKQSEHQALPMPLATNELLVLQRCLRVALNSDETNEADKSVIRRMEDRIVRYAERQGAWWDHN